jgi:hypothetical protein
MPLPFTDESISATQRNLEEALLMRSDIPFSTCRRTLKWSGLATAVAMLLMTVGASAQMAGGEKGKKHPDTQKTEDRAKKKVDEKAYQDALKSVPASNEKPDPWKSMR